MTKKKTGGFVKAYANGKYSENFAFGCNAIPSINCKFTQRKKQKKRLLMFNDDGHLVGESHPRATISDEVVDEIRNLREGEEERARATGLIGEDEELPQHLRHWTYKRLAKKFNCSIWTIRDIASYRTRCHTVAETRLVLA